LVGCMSAGPVVSWLTWGKLSRTENFQLVTCLTGSFPFNFPLTPWLCFV
jgi:hypothetical protein